MKDTEVIQTYLEYQASICFNILYERYSPKIFAKCITLLKDEGLAQDATQEIFIKIFTNLTKFGGKSSFSTWVYSITYNFCIDFIRKKKKLQNVFSEDIEKAPDIEDDGISDKELLELEISLLKRVLDDLPLGDRVILLMKYQDGTSIKEIAETLDKTESAVKMKIKRAKERAKKLKQTLIKS